MAADPEQIRRHYAGQRDRSMAKVRGRVDHYM
jgi:hypothetical protein